MQIVHLNTNVQIVNSLKQSCGNFPAAIAPMITAKFGLVSTGS